ncbi:hypothetical protein Rumeso_01066 [Rubellimicrobium mesophilum DSM 19309]|uniref:Uncharacterized protein n=1 Tax=Rubellimicrobium mesophilum DSM 19309 TaxID=442562 RepID=A0A017HUC1_9RHOB|nr:hypothetical protein [Rubellimicrobium mesophilum]EYD77359.1 hypothetical protein Rumeso_01066 [Rubellimicrobium mesophilum DSM 19309]
MFDMTSHTLEGSLALTDRQMDAIESVAEQIERLSDVIRAAVDSGLSVELHRSARYHSGQGCWGDVMRPVIVKCGSAGLRMPQVSSSS